MRCDKSYIAEATPGIAPSNTYYQGIRCADSWYGEAGSGFDYSSAKHTSILIGDGCRANTVNDQIEYVKLNSHTSKTISGTVGYKPLHSGGWTMSSGVSVQCWHYAGGKWDSSPILSKQDAGIGYSYGYGKGPSRTHSFTFSPRAAAGDHFVRCGIIDRSSKTCKFDAGNHCASRYAGKSSGHHYDNADVKFTSTGSGGPTITVGGASVDYKKLGTYVKEYKCQNPAPYFK